MQVFELLDRVETPDGRDLSLYRRGSDFFIHIDREELMASRASHSEAALARLTLDALPPRSTPHVLIGGLGMGFTLRAALDARPRIAITVAEIFPAVILWNRTWLADLAGAPLADPRVRVVESDIAHLLTGARDRFDAILLDVDNGPHAMTLDSNDRLYSLEGLQNLGRALTPDGVLGIWSARAEPPFADRLRHAGFAVSHHRPTAAKTRRGRRHVIYVARLQSPTPGLDWS